LQVPSDILARRETHLSRESLRKAVLDANQVTSVNI